MRIVINIRHFIHKGGAERTSARLVSYLVEKGNEVLIVTDDYIKDRPPPYEIPNKIEVYRKTLNLSNLNEIKEKIKNFNPDVGFIFYWDSAFIMQYLTLENICPIGAQECTNPVRIIENISTSENVESIQEAFKLREAFMANIHVVRLVMKSYEKSVPHLNKNIFGFPNAYYETKKTANLTPQKGRKRIISIGGLKAENKNGLTLVEAFCKIAKKYPDWDLHFFGGRALFSNAQKLASEYRCKDQILSTAHVEDIASEYSKSQIHAIPSYHEGCPNALCEAMTHGLPSVGFADCPGVNELIVNGKNGFLVERYNGVENLSLALEKLILDEELRVSFGEQALKESKLLFDPDKIFSKWVKIFDKLYSYTKDQDKIFTERKKIDSEYQKEIYDYWQLKLKSIKGKKEYKNHLPLVSFIIPLYNKEDYVEETILSIQNCGYKNIEIIVVNDFSTDKSVSIIKTLQTNFSNIKLYHHKKNRGLSASRNTALEHAKGKYIQFWDADDIYAKDNLEKIILTMEEDRSDITSGFATRDNNVLRRYSDGPQMRGISFRLYPDVFFTNSSCFKVYRSSFLKKEKLRFVEGLHIEDVEFNLRAFGKSRIVSCSEYIIGEYRKVENSLGKIFSEERINSCYDIEDITKKFFNDENLNDLEFFRQKRLIEYCYMYFIRRLLQSYFQKGPFKDTIFSINKDVNNEICFKHLNTFAKILKSYDLGIKNIANDTPDVALAIIALSNKQYALANDILLSEVPSYGFEYELSRDNRFSLNEIFRLSYNMQKTKDKLYPKESSLEVANHDKKNKKPVIMLTKKQKLWYKFYSTPKQFLKDSNFAYFRFLSHFVPHNFRFIKK